MTNALRELETVGRVWFRSGLSAEDLTKLDDVCETADRPGARLSWSARLREALGPASDMARLAEQVVPGGRPVRFVAFDKSNRANWSLPWHQDRVIAVAERHDVPGFGAWSRKGDVWHCEPPTECLRSMVFARIHLDRADESNGCMELALGTHLLGRVAAGSLEEAAGSAPHESCVAERGDVLFVKALTLHRSGVSNGIGRRRALRVDYSAWSPPAPLAFAP